MKQRCRRGVGVWVAVSIALAISGPLLSAPALAYTSAGDRTFPATLLLPQSAPVDDLYLTPMTMPLGGGPPGSPSRATNITATYGKTITDRLGISIEETYTRLDLNGAGTLSGFQNFDGALKYEAILAPDHEFLLTVGIDRETGGTGAQRVGASRLGATTPTVYFAKGLGDLDIGYLRPLAILGDIGYQIADQSPRPNLVVPGVAIQYSIPYLESKVAPLDLPDFMRRLTPTTEFFFTTPGGKSYGERTTGLIAPGLTYAGAGYEVGVEALVPTSRATGSGVGVVAQVHVSLDYLLPESIGRPLFSDP